jgi:hypothetical protein
LLLVFHLLVRVILLYLVIFELFLLFLLLYEKSLLLYKIQEISFVIQEARSLICYIGSLFYFKSYTCTYIPFTLVFTCSFFYF